MKSEDVFQTFCPVLTVAVGGLEHGFRMRFRLSLRVGLRECIISVGVLTSIKAQACVLSAGTSAIRWRELWL